jgi:cell division protein FtsN
MLNNDTGEFELVLGNRQLLSGFAIVAILFGVFFAMGYIVGRNSSASVHVAASDSPPVSSTAASQPDPSRAQPQASPLSTAQASDANPSTAATPLAETPLQPATQAGRETAAKAVLKPAESQTVAVNDPQPGTYLQVMAVKRVDAEVIVKALQGKGFATLMTPSPLEGMFRVLVGPYKDATILGNAKTELENSGFHPIVQKIADRN